MDKSVMVILSVVLFGLVIFIVPSAIAKRNKQGHEELIRKLEEKREREREEFIKSVPKSVLDNLDSLGVDDSPYPNDTEIEYSYNSATSGGYSCRKFSIDVDNETLIENGNYTESQLTTTKVTDPNGNSIITFKDSEERILLERRLGEDSQNKDTYWVYDIYGNLRYIIPPNAVYLAPLESGVPTEVINKLCFSYKYDSKGRLIEKRLPSAEPIYYVYDKLNKLIFSQDGNQRSANQWMIYKYDDKHRIIVEAIASFPSQSRESLQESYGDTLLTETYSNIDMLLFYTESYGFSEYKALKSYFYDNYEHWIGELPTDSEYIRDTTYEPKGLLTGTAVASDQYIAILTAFIYDAKGNIIQESEKNYYQEYAINTFYSLDFRGKPTGKKQTHSFGAEGYYTENYTQRWKYTYGNGERLQKVEHKYNDQDWKVLSENSYDSLGKLIKSTYGCSLNSNNINTNQLSYNIRGDLTEINSPHFQQELHYANAQYGAEPNYNRNISSAKISSLVTDPSTGITDMQYMHMKYSYDNFNQLTHSSDSTISDNYCENFMYDMNGNIIQLSRGYDGHEIQELHIVYDGNQMSSISYDGNNYYAGEIPIILNNGDNTNIEAFDYDANGNLTKDLTRDVTSVTYDHNNIPNTINFSSGNQVLYKYSADGNKTHRINKTKRIVTHTYTNSSGEEVTIDIVVYDTHTRNYYGSLIKENSSIKRIYNEVGYIEIDPTSKVGTYHYHIKDNLGSTRAVINDSGSYLQATDYYPGGIATSKSFQVSEEERLHTGKEINSFSGLHWYDNMARIADPITVRFNQIDPLAEKYPQFSPYAYCANNPINFI
ncbi:MAG: RHS repeat-associated core domain-containing protein, partial [Bacteroidales bacterium]